MAVLPRFLEGAAFGVFNDILSGFRSNEGYARPNHYEVVIYKPALSSQNGNNQNQNRGDLAGVQNMDKISMRCESVQLPGRNLSTVTDSNIYGPTRDIVEGVTYAEDLNMVFQASSGLDERVFFENWQRQAFNENTWDVQYYNDYVGEVEIYLLDKQEQRRYGLKLHEAFPKTIAGNDLSMGSSGEIIKTSVGFAFRFWSALNITQQAPSFGDRAAKTISNVFVRNLTRNIPRLRLRL